MGRILVVGLLAATLGGAFAVAGTARTGDAGAPAEAAFRLADGSVGCAFDGRRLACRSVDAASAVVLEQDGSSYAEDVAVRWDDATTVLRPTESWWHGAFGCRVADADVVCWTPDGGSVAVGPAGFGGASSAETTLP